MFPLVPPFICTGDRLWLSSTGALPPHPTTGGRLMIGAKRGALMGACAAILYCAGFGCGPSMPDKINFAGQNATLQSGTQVNFQECWVSDGKFVVKMWVQNLSQAFMMVNRDGFALRVSD